MITVTGTPSSSEALTPERWRELLEPIPGPKPCGEALRYEGTYDQVRRARQADDQTLAQGVWETTLKRADWHEVAGLCTAALSTRSKDLQLAAWLLEAWIHLHGLAGAAAGLALIEELCQRYWPDLHPELENGEPEFRYAVFRWINEKLATDLKLVPLTAPRGAEVAVCTWADRERAQHLAQAGAREAGIEEAAAAGRAAFQKSLALTPFRWLTEQQAHARAIAGHAQAIGQLLDAGGVRPDSPGLVGLKRVAESIADFLAPVLARRRDEEHSDQVPAQLAQLAEAAPRDNAHNAQPASGAAPRPALAIRSRHEAYEMLSAVAVYLAATEPHSPVPYLVERAVAWGAMDLAQLLPELVGDAGHLQDIHRLLRIGTAARTGGVTS